MWLVTGRTFEHRDLLQTLGGWWNNVDRQWQFERLNASQLAQLRACVGMIVSSTQERKPEIVLDDDGYDMRCPPNIRNKQVIIGDDLTYYGMFAQNEPLIFAGFSSLGTFIDHVEALERPLNRGGTCDVGWTAKPGYAGTDSLEHALDVARNGWSDGLGIGENLLPPDPLVKRRKRAVAGGRVNIGRMLSGAPDHMVKRERQPGKKIITLFVETVMWEGISANNALIRVIAIAAIVDRLEQHGYSCNIVSAYCAMRRDRRAEHHLVVTIKEAGERLSVSDISFAFGHPSFGRRLVYAHHGCIPQCDMTTMRRGFISEAFNRWHKPPPQHFYIPQIRQNISDIWKMIKHIVPDNLPITIERD